MRSVTVYITFGIFLLVPNVLLLPCSYWCEVSCVAKGPQYYCCSFEPSLTGPTQFLPPPCQDKCINRPENLPAQKRNCNLEKELLGKTGSYKLCRKFSECDRDKHDACCHDNCLDPNEKMCVSFKGA